MIASAPDKTWQRATKRTPCQICTHTKGCMVAPNGDVVCLHKQSDESVPFGPTAWWHRTDAPIRPDRGDTPAPATPKPETAPIEARDRVNRRLLELCAPSPAHRTYLASFHDSPALSALYGSLPRGGEQRPLIATLVSEFGFDLLCTVPGFIIKNGHLRLNGAGLLVAINDVEGHLVGFQVRYGPGDYRWLSTSTGPSTGAPAHVARPLVRRDSRVYVVESPKSANVLAERLGAIVIATAGHGNDKGAHEPLRLLMEREGAEVVVTAFDADDPEAKATTVALVEQSRQQLAAAAREMGFHVKLARWAHADGKGPDDLLLGGHTWELAIYRPSSNASAAEGENTSGIAPRAAGTLHVQREALQRAYAKNDDLTRAYNALYRFALSEGYTESEKKMVLWTLHEKCNHGFGLPVPEVFGTVYIKDDEKPRAGLSVNSFDTARKRFVEEGVLIETVRQPGEGSESGRPYKVFTVNGQRLEHLIATLDANPGVQAEERQARAATRAQEARERYEKAIEKRERREEQDRITRQQLASISAERRRYAETTEQLAHQLTEKEVEAQAMRRAAEDAQREAQRIIQQARRDSIPCGGCGTLIHIADWRCDDCRAEGTDADRFTPGEFSPSFGGKGYDDGQRHPVTVPQHSPSTTRIPPKLGEKSPLPQPPTEDLKPCRGDCGALTPHGFECKPCRLRPPGPPLHAQSGFVAR